MKQDKLNNNGRNHSEFFSDIDYQRRVLFLSFENRIFNIIVAIIVINILKKGVGLFLPEAVVWVFYGWFAVVVFYLAIFKLKILKTLRALSNAQFSYYFFGISFATLLVHFLGGVEWIGFFLYIFDIVYGNALMSRLRGIIVSLFACMSYLVMSFLEYSGIVYHHSFLTVISPLYDQTSYFIAMNIVVTSFLLLLAFVTGLFSQLKEDREKNILDSKSRFKTKAEQLEKMAIALKKKVSENAYIRRAALGYVEKKEFELRVIRKDLEEQIEKQRRTQKSMLFMIEDLNEMSNQLKDSKDHLEDKVRERTDELLHISKRLHRSERLAFLGRLAGSVTHELRDPLAVMKNSIEYMDMKIKSGQGDGNIQKYIDLLKKQVSTINRIIDDIMGFAKTQPADLVSVNLAEVLKDILKGITIPQMIKLKKEFESVPKMMVDKNQLRHTVTNVTNNAIIAMKGSGELTVRIKNEEKGACIEIEDDGPGIPPDERELIFEPLYSSKPKGTGLGLPIARMMIENQGGRLDFETEVGKGTVFKIHLPIREEKA